MALIAGLPGFLLGIGCGVWLVHICRHVTPRHLHQAMLASIEMQHAELRRRLRRLAAAQTRDSAAVGERAGIEGAAANERPVHPVAAAMGQADGRRHRMSLRVFRGD